ncbi:MAG: hypothetical protein HGA45_26395 [Chloroflexales bacterium]|nr:hypothetical protein [Chloroflexales bacterium]
MTQLGNHVFVVASAFALADQLVGLGRLSEAERAYHPIFAPITDIVLGLWLQNAQEAAAQQSSIPAFRTPLRDPLPAL